MICPTCKSETCEVNNNLRDTYSDNHFDIAHCNSCNYEWINDPPTTDEIGKYYDNFMGDIMRTKRTSLFSKMQSFLFNLDVKPLLKKCSKDDLIIDWGTGHGQIAQIIKDQGYNVTAVDIFPKINWKIEDIPYLEIDSNNIESLFDKKEFKENKPKGVILRHTLEHFHYPEKLVNFFYDIGIEYVLIIVPNHNSFLRRVLKKYWPYWDPPRHLNFYSPKNLDILFSNQNYEILKHKTYGLDEFMGAMIRWVKLNHPKNKFLNSIFHYNSILLAISSSLSYLFTNAVIWSLYKKK